MKKFLLIFMLCLVAVASAQQQSKKVWTVNDFGKGMVAITTPYANDVERIVLSENMFSGMFGGRQMRYGLRSIDTIAISDSAGKSLIFFSPQKDSGHIVNTAGGKWFGNVAGGRFSQQVNFTWHDFLTDAKQIRPANVGDSVVHVNDSLRGYNTRFTRDYQPGDTIDIGGGREIDFIVSDEKLFITATWASDDTATTWQTSRSHATGDVYPFLHQSGEYLYTGTFLDPPQIIYTLDDTLRIRPMGIVDSFFIDAMYSRWPSTSAGWDSTDIYGIQSWDTVLVDSGAEFIKRIQLVSRRKKGQWTPNQWLESLSENPEAYYVRVGFEDNTSFYAIDGNTDTSIFLLDWYVEQEPIADNQNVNWSDSLFLNRAQEMDDTIPSATAVGTWGYIYSAVGFSRIIVDDDDTETATLFGRGAMFVTVDATFPIGVEEFRKGMHYIHLTGSDIEFPEFSQLSAKTVRERITYLDTEERQPTQDQLPEGDTIRSIVDVWRCEHRGNNSPYRDTFDEAAEDCHGHADQDVIHYRRVRITTNNDQVTTTEAKAIGNSYFPITHAIAGTNDTIYFLTGVSPALTDPTTVSTDRWEIVRIGLPNWSGMTEWGLSKQLVAWGDTASPALLSFSGVLDNWNWSVTNDVMVGKDLANPVIGVLGYQEQLVIWKRAKMFGLAGGRFTELSLSDGLVGPRARIGLTNELYWLDVDGLKNMKRRDFVGFSIEPVSTVIDPVFNGWNRVQFGDDIVPFRIDPSTRHNAVLVHNQRDHHLYLFADFSVGGAAFTAQCVVYDTRRNIWDGIFTIGAADAIWTTYQDTSRILILSPDSTSVFAMDYTWTDFGGTDSGIDGQLRSGNFWAVDAQGRPMESMLNKVFFHSRSLAGAIDSGYINIIGDDVTTRFDLSYAGLVNPTDKREVFYDSTSNRSIDWQWEIRIFGSDAATMWMPIKMQIEAVLVTEDR